MTKRLMVYVFSILAFALTLHQARLMMFDRVGVESTNGEAAQVKYEIDQYIAPQASEAHPTKSEKLQVARVSPEKSLDYYSRGYEVMKEFLEREDAVNRMNKNQVSEAQREYYMKIIDRMTSFHLKSVELKLKEIKAELGS